MRTTFPVSVPPAGWSALADPTRLAAALPGCRSVEADGDGTLTVVTDVSVASVLGLWAGTVTRVDEHAVRIAGSGAPGEIDLTIRANPARTTLTVEGEVSGPLATVGAAVLAAAARRLAETLLANLTTPAPATPLSASAPDPGPAVRQRAPVVAAVATAAIAAIAAVTRARRRRRRRVR